MKTLATFGVRCAAVFMVMAMVISIVPLNGIISTVTAAGPKGPAPVDLGTAGDFVILAKSGISTTGTTLITGNIGVSPIDQTALTGFSETIDSSGQYSTSAYVVGKLYASDYAIPTPVKMTTAIGDMETAYTNAAGRTLPNGTELYAGILSGKTFTPGLYKWSSGVMWDSTGVTLSGGANDVWIFQIAQDLTVADASHVNLIGGARASNIFWQVAGGTGVTLGTTSVFNGNILAVAGVVMNTGATLNGRALAQTAVTLDANPVSIPSDVPISSVNTIIPYWKNTSPLTITATGSASSNYIKLYSRFAADNITWGAWTLFGNDTAAPWSWSFNFPNASGHYQFYSRAFVNTTSFETAPGIFDQFCGYDIIAPTSSVNAIASYWKLVSPLAVTAIAADAMSGVKNVTLYSRYSADNATWGAWTSFGVDLAAPWSWSFTFTSGTGNYQFYSRAYDNATNFEAAPAAADQICGYDTIAPTSSVDAISHYWWNTPLLGVTVTASDATSGIKNITLYYRTSADNATWGVWTVISTDLAAPWSWDWSGHTGGGTNGYYELYSIAVDNTSNVEAAPAVADVKFGYDNMTPTSACNVAGTYWNNASVTITATGSDALSGLASVELFYRYGAVNGTFGTWTSAGVDAASPWSWSFAFASGQGYYEYYTRGTDKALNIEAAPAAADIIYAYDNEKPVTGTDTTPISVLAGKTLTFNIAITDNIGVTAAKVVYRFGTGAWVNQTLTLSTTYQYVLTIPSTSTLSVQYYVYASDIAGNWMVSQTKTVVVIPVTPPTVIILGPANGLISNVVKATVHGTANSTNDTVAKIDWALDNTTWTSCTGTTTWSCLVNLTEGSIKVTIRATDSLGNKGYKEVTLRLDLTVPTQTITGLKDNSTVKKSKLTISGTSADSTGIAKVEVRVNGGAWQSATGTSAWTYNATLKSGKNIIDIRTTDKAGNVVTKTETVKYKKAVAKGFIPGFEAIIFVAAAFIAVAVVAGKRRN